MYRGVSPDGGRPAFAVSSPWLRRPPLTVRSVVTAWHGRTVPPPGTYPPIDLVNHELDPL